MSSPHTPKLHSICRQKFIKSAEFVCSDAELIKIDICSRNDCILEGREDVTSGGIEICVNVQKQHIVRRSYVMRQSFIKPAFEKLYARIVHLRHRTIGRETAFSVLRCPILWQPFERVKTVQP